uniref:Uncharacterized protein n=1 Tax=viral metagenome TaxID=1070528 RepID=A0A6M3LAQ9_9ZZZZ
MPNAKTAEVNFIEISQPVLNTGLLTLKAGRYSSEVVGQFKESEILGYITIEDLENKEGDN